MLEEESLKSIAAQLRQPNGEQGIETALMMNEGNLHLYLNTLKTLNAAGGDHILEIGMGNGLFVKEILLKDPSIKYFGCDYSDLMVAEAMKLNEKFVEAGQAIFQFGKAEELPFDEDAFDLVFTVNTIYFWEDIQVILNQIARVMKNHGELIIALRPKRVMEQYPFVKYGFKMYEKEELADLLAENGFTVTTIKELEEPEQEIGEMKLKVESLIICALKNKIKEPNSE